MKQGGLKDPLGKAAGAAVGLATIAKAGWQDEWRQPNDCLPRCLARKRTGRFRPAPFIFADIDWMSVTG